LSGRRIQADVLVTDLDHTFLEGAGPPDAKALQAVDRLRAAGTKTVLATGRGVAALRRWPELEGSFDAFILEGGAIWGKPGHWHLATHDLAPITNVAAALHGAGLPGRFRFASCSIDRRAEDVLKGIPEAASCSVHPNRDRLDILPRGVDKGAALRQLLSHWGLSRARVAAVGDGENDLELFAAAAYAVAVANAVQPLKAAADEVAPVPASEGVAWFVTQRLLGPEP
jgi:hydroxymethylpyrimidine pyrophosphatase-like HAD family hydrolase